MLSLQLQLEEEERVSEMPHLEAEPPVVVGGKKLQYVDLQIEKYPLSKSDKDRLFDEFSKNGLIGKFHGVNIHFKPDYTMSVSQDISGIEKLPSGWENLMKFVSESQLRMSRAPTMVNLFESR